MALRWLEATPNSGSNGSKVRTRGSLVCRAVTHGSAAAILLWAIPAHAADDGTELLVEVKKQLEQSQRQMEQGHRQLEQSQRQLEQSQREVKALKRQVEVLTKRVEQTSVAPARGVAPAPDAKDVVVMLQQSGNLPGRKQEPPAYSSSDTA
jgi:septal ring factor EnvC (AmiA/AmiB activator)